MKYKNWVCFIDFCCWMYSVLDMNILSSCDGRKGWKVTEQTKSSKTSQFLYVLGSSFLHQLQVWLMKFTQNDLQIQFFVYPYWNTTSACYQYSLAISIVSEVWIWEKKHDIIKYCLWVNRQIQIILKQRSNCKSDHEFFKIFLGKVSNSKNV